MEAVARSLSGGTAAASYSAASFSTSSSGRSKARQLPGFPRPSLTMDYPKEGSTSLYDYTDKSEMPASDIQRSAEFYEKAGAPEITARFRDPGGNIIGLYQQPGKG